MNKTFTVSKVKNSGAAVLTTDFVGRATDKQIALKLIRSALGVKRIQSLRELNSMMDSMDAFYMKHNEITVLVHMHETPYQKRINRKRVSFITK